MGSEIWSPRGVQQSRLDSWSPTGVQSPPLLAPVHLLCQVREELLVHDAVHRKQRAGVTLRGVYTLADRDDGYAVVRQDL